MPTGGKLIVDLLANAGVRHVFTVPGESFIDVLDAMHDGNALAPITTRNEAGAAIMAEATGKLTGQPGVALVTRGPGAANALTGVYIAAWDSSPMALLVGLPKRSTLPQFQAIDLMSVYGGLAKSCAVVAEPAALGEALAGALNQSTADPPGPVVLGLPEDLLSADVPNAATLPVKSQRSVVHERDIKRLFAFLSHAERPLVIAGSARWSGQAADALSRFAAAHDLPVATSFRRQDRMDNRLSSYVGHLGLQCDSELAKGVRSADLIIAFGDAFDPVTTANYRLVEAPRPAQQIVVTQPSPSETAIRPTHTIFAEPAEFVLALAAASPETKPARWSIWRRDLRSAFLATIRQPVNAARLTLETVIADLSGSLPDNAIVCSGAGDYAASVHRSFVYKSYPSQLAPRSGSMGYGLPAAIAAKLAYPDRCVVAIAGDGCLQMTVQELATAVQFGLPIILIVANNARLGTIRRHQEMRFPGRVVATSLLNPDFQSLATAYGVPSARARNNAEFNHALAAALDAKTLFLIELVLD